VDAGLLDVLHDAAQVHLAGAVAQRVDVDLDGVVEEAVDQHRVLGRDGHVGNADRGCSPAEEVAQRRVVVHDLHTAPAEHVRRPDQHRVADLVGDPLRLVVRGGRAVRRRTQPRPREHRPEGAAVLGQVDRLR
jgi:hypothetical protein